jgi:hypothetical protein
VAEIFQREVVYLFTESHDLANTNSRDNGVVTKVFPLVNVTNVDFDGGGIDACEGIA